MEWGSQYRAADVVCELPLPSTMREAREREGGRGGYARDNAQRIMQEMLYGDRPHRPPGQRRGRRRAEMRLFASGMFAIEREVQSILVMEVS